MGEKEKEMANEILAIVSNLDSESEAKEYARLYLKAQKEAVKVSGEEYNFDKVYKLISETDSRFKDRFEE